METQKNLNSQNNLEKEWVWISHVPWFLQSYSNQTCMELAPKGVHRLDTIKLLGENLGRMLFDMSQPYLFWLHLLE